MSDAADADIFPLPLVPFERYMLADDTREYPMTYTLAFDFRGEFERSALDGALMDALSRHPLLRARIEDRPRKGACWVGISPSRISLDWGTCESPIECSGGGVIDLRREAGLRLWVRQGDDRARLTLLVHHACADGVGMLQFVRDLLVAYAVRAGSEVSARATVRLAAERLNIRDRFDVKLPEPVSSWRILGSNVTESAKFFSRRPAPLAAGPECRSRASATPADDAKVGPGHGPGDRDSTRSSLADPAITRSSLPEICSHTFSEAETSAIHAAAARHNATVNDVLLRDAFVVVADWNAAQDPATRRHWLRINMPINLRGVKHRHMPAANAMSYAFLTRRDSDRADPRSLLDGIRRETEAIRYWSLGLTFLDGLRFSLKVPGLMRLSTRRRRCLASLVLSNLGDLSRYFPASFVTKDRRVRAANVVLENLIGAPPIRSFTRGSMLASRYAGRLTLSLLCDPRCFSAADARTLLSNFVNRLQETGSCLPADVESPPDAG